MFSHYAKCLYCTFEKDADTFAEAEAIADRHSDLEGCDARARTVAETDQRRRAD